LSDSTQSESSLARLSRRSLARIREVPRFARHVQAGQDLDIARYPRHRGHVHAAIAVGGRILFPMLDEDVARAELGLATHVFSSPTRASPRLGSFTRGIEVEGRDFIG